MQEVRHIKSHEIATTCIAYTVAEFRNVYANSTNTIARLLVNPEN